VKYRAIVITPNWSRDSKPLQKFGENRADLEQWCRNILNDQPDKSEAVIFEQTEKPVFRTMKTTNLANEPVVTEKNG
jgi:hypothetical protein